MVGGEGGVVMVGGAIGGIESVRTPALNWNMLKMRKLSFSTVFNLP